MCEPVTLATLGSTLLGTGAAATGAAATGAAVAGTAATATAASAATANTILAIQGVTAGVSALAAADGAKRQNAAAALNNQSALDAYFLKSKQNQLSVIQEQTQASQQRQDANLKALKAQGTATAVAGASGVQGTNVAQLLNDFERSEGVMTDRIQQRLEGVQNQAAMTTLGFQSEAQNRINSMQPQGFAETLFNVAEPIAGFAIDYKTKRAEQAAVEG